MKYAKGIKFRAFRLAKAETIESRQLSIQLIVIILFVQEMAMFTRPFKQTIVNYLFA